MCVCVCVCARAQLFLLERGDRKKQVCCVLRCRAQEVFKQALQTDRIRLRVIRAAAPPLPKQPPPLLPKKPSNLDLSQNTAQPSSSPIKLEDLNPPANEVCRCGDACRDRDEKVTISQNCLSFVVV